MTRHLPRVFYAKDIVFGKSSALESVACLFEDGKVINKSYTYERRTLRVMIQERLYALESLTNARDIGQVFLDVACSTCHFCFLITIRLPHFSSSLALRRSRDTSSRPEPL